MNLLPKAHQEFSQKEYWDNFFKKRGNRAFEWYGEYPELSAHLHKYITLKDDILIVGCGNSTLGRDLHDLGHRTITNIDISQVVINQMLKTNETTRPDLKFIQMDATHMTFKNESFRVVLDKGTLDALMTDDEPETIEKINMYFNEINRVLNTGGRYLCVSLLQKHILKKIISYFPSNNWMLRITRCFESENKAREEGESLMPVFIIVATKFIKLPRLILEVNMSSEDKMQRMDTIDEIFTMIMQVQEAAILFSGLQRSSVVDEKDVSVNLFKPGENSPRYTIYIVDIPPERKFSHFAAFIVPQGREAEWLFSTSDGRKSLTKMTKYNRLAVVILYRKQIYESLDAIQNEIGDAIQNLAPSKMKDKILFMSLGADVGQRIIQYEGHSDLSGDYVVEDVIMSNAKMFRRLYYMDTQNVIQSEAKLRTVKSKKGKKKVVVDTAYLTCCHHKYMSVGTHMACVETSTPHVAIIGLGGGGLCSFLQKFLPKANLEGIDIDEDMLKVAKEWFGLQEDNKLNIYIMDGIEFIKGAVISERRFNAILFDVDSKDTNIGMSCPPRQFLERRVLEDVKTCLSTSDTDTGDSEDDCDAAENSENETESHDY